MTAKEITVVPNEASIEKVQNFLEEEMTVQNVAMEEVFRINIAVDEIYSNIVRYSHAEWAKAGITVTAGDIRIVFRDNGVPFNLLEQDAPDTGKSLENDDEIGGLGIFMTRQLMDEVTYAYEQGCNICTIRMNRKS